MLNSGLIYRFGCLWGSLTRYCRTKTACFCHSWEWWNIRNHTPILYHTFRLCLCCIPGDSTIVTQYYARWYIFERPSISRGTGTHVILYRVDSKCRQIKLLVHIDYYIFENIIFVSHSHIILVQAFEISLIDVRLWKLQLFNQIFTFRSLVNCVPMSAVSV